MIKSKKQSFIIIGVFALVLMLGTVTYAFFNYTRTGTANSIRTGRISFNTSQSNTLNLTNVFPMSATDAGNANLDAVSVRIWGDTTYSSGEEFEISIVDVNNTIGSGQNAKTIPINYIASYSATPVQSGDPNVIGTNSDSYFTARGQSSPVYQLSATGEATNGEQVLIGYIPSGATGIDGTLTIKAYLDSSKIAISDTYNDGNTPTDNMGTPASFGEGKTVLTTTEWNALQNTQTPLSFKIKAVSQEGTWVEEPVVTIPTIASCPGCKFMYKDYTGNYKYGLDGSTLTDVENNGDELVDDYTTLNSNIFLGFKIENDVITKAYACGIKKDSINQETAFCLEVPNDETSIVNSINFLTGPTLLNDPDGVGRCEIRYAQSYDETLDEWIDKYKNTASCGVDSIDGSIHVWIKYDEEDNTNTNVNTQQEGKWCYVGYDYFVDVGSSVAYCGDIG